MANETNFPPNAGPLYTIPSTSETVLGHLLSAFQRYEMLADQMTKHSSATNTALLQRVRELEEQLASTQRALEIAYSELQSYKQQEKKDILH